MIASISARLSREAAVSSIVAGGCLILLVRPADVESGDVDLDGAHDAAGLVAQRREAGRPDAVAVGEDEVHVRLLAGQHQRQLLVGLDLLAEVRVLG